ncbi:MAG TPA: tripartite tricarboxylate transporter substrate-binding protein, partial [Candidimonas sp.]|nr:tripartite tricarboxylate transporter substrate-binding protein [Candidimonas sp.]
KAVIDKLNKELVATLKEPEVSKKLIDFGVQPVGNTPEEYAALLETETKRWHKLIGDLGIKLD